MGRAHLNIWILEHNCVPIKNCWKLDLYIRTCSGEHIQSFDPDIIAQLQGQFPAAVTVTDNIDRITIYDSSRTTNLNHVMLDVVPLCYIIKARVCFDRNEDTSSVVRFLNCEDRACVRLLVPEIQQCGKGIFHPGGLYALRAYVQHPDIKGYIRTLKRAGNLNLADLAQEADQRVIDAGNLGLPPEDIQHLQTFKTLIDEVIAEGTC